MATQYTHAKDFLIEFAQKPQTKGWLKDLIIKVITTNGNLTGEDILDFTNQLKGNGASTLAIPITSQANDNTEIKFVELKHNRGVCALADNQVIKFSDQITLLYGSNGSGKSSYFRVLNEIIGGNRHTPIVSNIYVENPSPINVDIVYSSNGIQHTINWTGDGRGISPFNMASVFDSGYTKAFLEKRNADSAIVYPYGLHLFTSLTKAFDDIKKSILIEIDTITKSLPTINSNDMSNDIRNVLKDKAYSEPQRHT